MSSFLHRVHSLTNTLTPNELQIADYLCRNPQQAMSNSIKTVAQATGVSIASVSRLAGTLGYRDWKELRLALAQSSVQTGNPVLSDIAPEDDDEVVIRKVFQSNIVSLQETLSQIDVSDIQRVVDAVGKTRRIVFFGSGGAGCIAKDEAIRFAHLELSAEAYTEEFHMMLQAARMEPGQMAFGFSNSGRSRAVVTMLAEARRNGSLTVGISNYRNTPLEDESDIFLCTAVPRRGDNTASLTARIAIQSLMDAIYVLAAQRGHVAGKVQEIDRILENALRIKAKNRLSGVAKKNGMP